MAEIQEKYQTFKLLESRLLQSRQRMLGKVPHIEKAIDMVDLLLAKETASDQITVDFELSDHVYTKATIKKVRTPLPPAPTSRGPPRRTLLFRAGSQMD